jgi:hypothetical protein
LEATTMANNLRVYTVTVTPKIVTYSGVSTFAAYRLDVTAASRAEAIRRARRERSENEGREGVPASFTAKLSADQEGL